MLSEGTGKPESQCVDWHTGSTGGGICSSSSRSRDRMAHVERSEDDPEIEDDTLQILAHLEDPVPQVFMPVHPTGVPLNASAGEVEEHLRAQLERARSNYQPGVHRRKNRPSGLKYKKEKKTNKDTSNTCSTKKLHRKRDSDNDGKGDGGSSGGPNPMVV